MNSVVDMRIADVALRLETFQAVDIHHRLSRLRYGKNLPDAEVELMQNYDQVVEVRAGAQTVLNSYH